MTIQVGDRIPSVVIKKIIDTGLKDQNTDEIFNNKKVVLFGIPAAFSPTCSTRHMPGYLNKQNMFKALGIDVVCMSVNDPFVMKAWAQFMHAEGIEMLADGNAVFTKALGLKYDGTSYGLGLRCKRFALYAVDGVVKHIAIEMPGAFKVSSADEMLKFISSYKIAA